MTELRSSKHAVSGDEIWEVWEAGRLIGAVYPMAGGVKIVSPYIENHEFLTVVSPHGVPALYIGIIGPNAAAIDLERVKLKPARRRDLDAL